MSSIICNAIEARRVLRFDYERAHCIVEPHVLGMNAQGAPLLRAYQLSATSDSHRSVGWKLFSIDGISGLTVLDETFSGPRPGFKTDDPGMTRILCCVSQ
jgi:hypothetical protein